MSFRKETFLKFKVSDDVAPMSYMDELSEEDISALFYEVLNDGIHGFCFSLYEEGQKPGDEVSDEQIRRRLTILKHHSEWVRTFSCTEGNERIPAIAKELGMKTMVGAWLGSDKEKNEEEMQGLYKLAEEGVVDIAAVGNEVLYREDLSLEELLGYLTEAKAQLDGIPVGYVDAYYEFSQHPEIPEICDVILCNCYPFWEGTSYEDSFQHMRQMFEQAKAAANGKKVIITETGWPSKGETLGGAIPGKKTAMKYFINASLWSQDEDVEIFYFSSFDESWKVSDEGEVGAYWGLWDKTEKLKY